MYLPRCLAARRANYDAELARWREDDRLCKAFAAVTSPIQATVATLVDDLLTGKGSDEEQLARVNGGLQALATEGAKMSDVEAQDATLKARNVSINPYTSVRSTDIQGELQIVQTIAEERRPFLEGQIEQKKYKGVTPEQFAEMQKLFSDFDHDHSGVIDVKELRACLFSLGEERSRKEVADYVSTHGSANGLAFDGFHELMSTLIGDAQGWQNTGGPLL